MLRAVFAPSPSLMDSRNKVYTGFPRIHPAISGLPPARLEQFAYHGRDFIPMTKRRAFCPRKTTISLKPAAETFASSTAIVQSASSNVLTAAVLLVEAFRMRQTFNSVLNGINLQLRTTW